LDHDGYLPDFAVITDGKTADVTAAYNFTLRAGSIVAVDRGYYDFDLFAQWNNSDVFFVTRLKSNAIYEVVKDCPLPQPTHPIHRLSEQTEVSGASTAGRSMGRR
jgi:hypothetical protein